jgi:hypothetical protein
LRKAQREQVKGIVVGGVEADELRAFWGERMRLSWAELLKGGTALPFFDDGPTIVITEGFGTRPMSRSAFDLLTQFDRQEVHLDGTTRLTAPQRRPRLVVPVAQASAATRRPVEVGSRVRLLDESHLGALGHVEAMRERGRLASGIRTKTFVVALDGGTRLELPASAIEGIE